VVLGITTSGRAAKTPVAQGTKLDFKVRSTATAAFCSGALHLKALHGLNTTYVLAALPLVVDFNAV
jgi:hypothetical protein